MTRSKFTYITMTTDKNASPPMKALDRHAGRRLAHRRQELGLDARALDQVLAVPPGSAARLETGERSMTAAQLLTLSGILAVPVDYFFEGSPDSGSANGVVPAPEMVTEAKQFLTELLRITDTRVQRDLLALVKAAGNRGPLP